MKKLGMCALAALVCLVPTTADAFCGFYVSGADTKLFANATTVVMMRGGTKTVLAMQNAYQGPPENFAMIVPVPVVLQKDDVRTLPRAVFDKIDQLGAPRLVEYWEQDPCSPIDDLFGAGGLGLSGIGEGGGGRGEGIGLGNFNVKVEAKFDVGEYEIVILSAKDATGLDGWLRASNYKIPEGAEPYLRPYVTQGSKFFVAKVNVAKVQFEKGQAVLSPLRFHYDSDRFTLPVRLGLINSSGTQDLIVNVVARAQRYEAANYPNVTIPTNLDVAEGARGKFGAFYNALFDRVVATHPRAVVTEYAWDTGSCDPCPGPVLDAKDLAVLGADVVPPSSAPPRGPGSSGIGLGGSARDGFVLTRMHVRYDKSGLGEDLVFRAVDPIEGGREWSTVPGKSASPGARPAPQNNFQARYAIRHPWKGPMACEHPRRGVWGEPVAAADAGPRLGGSGPPVLPATKIAFAPREGVSLASLLRSPVPEIALGMPAPLASSLGPSATTSGDPASVAASATSPPSVAASATPPSSASTPSTSGGCFGCAVGASRDATSVGALGSIALAFAWRRRRAARSHT